MLYANFLAVCNALGDQSLPEGQRWRSIVNMHIDNLPVFNFQDYYKNGKAYFVGDGTGPTGFVFDEELTGELSLTGASCSTFVDIEYVFSVSFNKTLGGNAAQLAIALGGGPTDFDAGLVVPDKIVLRKAWGQVDLKYALANIKVSDPTVQATAKFFKTEAEASAATADSMNTIDPVMMAAGETCYMRLFVEAPFTTTVTNAIPIEMAVPGNQPKLYTYTFYNWDKTVLKTTTVPEGTVIVAPAEEPTKVSDDGKNYKFSGTWSEFRNGEYVSQGNDFVEGMTISSDVEFAATFMVL